MKLNRFKAVIFNLNGVIVSTDEYHYQAWRQLADREGLHFDRIINERLKGVSRMQSLEILLSFNRDRTYTDEQKEEMAEFKNQRYLELIRDLRPSDVLPGVRTFCDYVKAKNIRIAVGSSSRNVKVILQNIGLLDYFDAVSDGTMIERSKPYPDVFVNAAKLLGLRRRACLVVEGADSGVEAAHRAGMEVLAVALASANPAADYRAPGLYDKACYEII